MPRPTTNSAFRPIQVRTDMAIEARDIVRGESHEEIPGVRVRDLSDRGVQITEVEIYQESAEKLMGKNFTAIPIPIHIPAHR